MTQATYRGSPFAHDASGSAPLVTLYERDDAIAVPLLSQLRMAGYDVRSSRTPVELFDILSKSMVALVLVDLGAATAGRREFWVALDAQRRGRAIQVMTFRLISPHGDLDLDNEPSARAIADVEARGVHEFQRIIDGVRQRIPLHGSPAAQGAHGMAGMPGMAPMNGASYAPNGGIQPLGAALGIAPTPFSSQNSHLFNAPPGATPASWGGIAPLRVSPFVSPLEQSPGGYPPGQQSGGFGAYGPMGPVNPMGPMGPVSPAPPQVSAQMETTPFDPAHPMPGMPGMPPYGAPSASPFANPTPSNPFGSGSSPFAQPYEANPFGGQPVSQPPTPPASQPPYAPPSPPWNGASVNGPAGRAPGAPSSFPPNYPPGFPPSFPPAAPSSEPPWGSSGRFAASPTSFDSDPGFGQDYGAASQPPYGTPDEPVFQDAWSPPESDGYDTPTGVVPEVDFQQRAPRHAAPSDVWETQRGAVPTPPRSAPSDAWETQRGAVPTPPREPDYVPPRSQFTAEPEEDGPTRAMLISTPTETALGGVLVDGALLTPSKLEALKGIQAMLAGVNIHRKLGDLALMFKFLSQDQLLAALLVSRGLVSPQQIASLGRVKQELAASGVENDLETLLVSFHVLPADKLRQIRSELAS